MTSQAETTTRVTLYEQVRHAARDMVFGRTLIAGSNPREVALTFDDGPNDPYTWQLLDLLARYDVKATFFLIGRFTRLQAGIARALSEGGHLIGNHSMNHPSLRWERSALIRSELAGCNAAIEDATGKAVRWFRPPFGLRSRGVLRAAQELDLTPVMWNVTAHDWDETNVVALASRVQDGITLNQERGTSSNILLHDGGHLQLGTDRSMTVAATGSLLQAWANSALRPVTIDRWAWQRSKQ